jgi:hypothetical protein
MVSWVNRQVIKPLDIQALEADGRTGDFLIAKAAYSLRSLGTRQATLAATGDTVARADGKFVVQVRRSSDDALKSFTADEITDGTLLAFVGTGGSDNGFVRVWYDQSVTTQAGDTATGNHAVQTSDANQPLIVSAGALVADNGIDFDGSTSSRTLVAFSVTGFAGSISMFSTSVRDATGNTVSLSNSSSGGRYFAIQEGGSTSVANPRNTTSITVSDSVSGTDRLTFALTTGATSTSVGALGSAVTTSTSDYGDDFSGTHINQIAIGVLRTASPTGYFDGRIREILVYNSDQTDNRTAIEANIGEAYSITGIPAYDDEVDGFVETWYDQSGNSRDSTQATAARQPIIVDAGVFQDGLKFTHTDATNGKILLVPRTAAELGQAFALVYVGKVTESDTSFNNLLGGLRGTQNYATGTTGIAIKSSDGSVAFINESGTSSLVKSTSSTTATLNEDFVAFATYEDQGAGPELTFQVDAGNQFFSLGSSYVTTSTKDIGIMNATAANGSYRTQESPTGICREVLVYDTHQGDNRVALVDNINNQYNLF